ncbi:MAG: uL15 family ribosomal protein [Candidatus Paceibacterota bacterium]
MQIHDLQRRTPNKTSRQIGRGGKRGKTSGRGHKGQKARAGHKIRPEIRDQIKKLPKLRGYRFASIQQKKAVVNLSDISENYADGDVVSPATLLEKKLIKRQGGVLPIVKVLGTGELTKKVTFEKVEFSETASGKTGLVNKSEKKVTHSTKTEKKISPKKTVKKESSKASKMPSKKAAK